MANDWIKFRCKLWDDPRVRKMSRECPAPRGQVIGALVRFWSLADQYAATKDGGATLEGLTPEDVNAEVELENFVESLPECWCRVVDGKLYLPEYQEHNGQTAKTRAADAKRKQASRRRPENVRADADKCPDAPGPEKRRLDKKRNTTTTIPPPVLKAPRRKGDHGGGGFVVSKEEQEESRELLLDHGVNPHRQIAEVVEARRPWWFRELLERPENEGLGGGGLCERILDEHEHAAPQHILDDRREVQERHARDAERAAEERRIAEQNEAKRRAEEFAAAQAKRDAEAEAREQALSEARKKIEAADPARVQKVYEKVRAAAGPGVRAYCKGPTDRTIAVKVAEALDVRE